MSAGMGAALPAVLLPYQQRWVADASPFKVAEKGRRTGLTWAEAADDVLRRRPETRAGRTCTTSARTRI